MPLSPDDEIFLTELQNIVANREPIDPMKQADNGDLYEPLYENDEDDPVALMHQQIVRVSAHSLQAFSGYRGSGKTTELFRLRQRLKQSGCVVFYANSLDYLSTASPVETGQFLLVLAGAFNDQLMAAGFKEALKESWWGRLKNILGTEVTVPEIEVSAEALGLGGNITLALKASETFKQQVSKAIVHRVKEVKDQVDLFFQEGIQAVRARFGEKAKVVFIFDSLEQIQGNRLNDTEVMRSLVDLFSKDRDYIRIPGLHMVLTVPPWINLMQPGYDVHLLTSQKLWQRKTRNKDNAGYLAITRLLKRRFGDDGFARLFGHLNKDGTSTLANQIIRYSGGHLRDLFRILEQALLRAKELPLTRNVAERAVESVRRTFLPLPSDIVGDLWQVHQTHELDYKADEPTSISRIALFLNSHVILNFRNGDFWFDLHPIVADRVQEMILARTAATD